VLLCAEETEFPTGDAVLIFENERRASEKLGGVAGVLAGAHICKNRKKVIQSTNQSRDCPTRIPSNQSINQSIEQSINGLSNENSSQSTINCSKQATYGIHLLPEIRTRRHLSLKKHTECTLEGKKLLNFWRGCRAKKSHEPPAANWLS
jgi:hypothetical protein